MNSTPQNTPQNLKCEITGNNYQENSFADRVHRYIRSKSIVELDASLEGVVGNLNDLLAWFEGLLWELSNHTETQLIKLHSFGTKKREEVEYQVFYQMWDKIGLHIFLKAPQLANLSFRLYKEFLGVMRKIQAPSKNYKKWVRFHKGGIYHDLGISLLYMNKKEEAKSYFLIAFIEDLIQQQKEKKYPYKNAPAYQTLKSFEVFHEEDKEIKSIKSLITKRLKEKKVIEVANPEFIYLEFMSGFPAKTRAIQYLLFDKIFATLLLNEIKRKVNKNNKKIIGDYFETLAAYLFFTIGKFEVSRNIKSLHSENDLRVRNLIMDDPILVLLGRYILVECKHWNNKVNSTNIKKFIANVRFARCETGIFLTRKEITGVSSRSSAWYVIRAEYHKDGVIIIVLNIEDIENIIDEKTDLLQVLKNRYEQVRFDEK